ncbi:Methylsterol monooxygenase [Alternaria tenuissima]|nr:Methylsterol monooxygenase [Alternaria tenuissima]
MSSIGQRWRDLVDAGDTRAAAERKLSKAVNDETGIDGQGARCTSTNRSFNPLQPAVVPSFYICQLFFFWILNTAKMNNATSILTPMAQDTYWGTFEDISTYNVQLNYLEKMWMAWYAWMGNDVLATGIMSFVIHEAFYFGRSLPWIIIDCIPFFNRYKIQAHKVPSAWEQTQCALLVLLSHFTVELPQIWLFHPMCQYFGLETSVPFPSIYKMAYQIAIFFVFEDAWHYWAHRAMHASSFLYKNIHKIHHQYSAPFGLAAEYASPIEVMILGFGSVGVPIVFCAITKDLHILTMYVWIIFRLSQAIDAHSGYEFPWSLHHFLPFWAGAEHHDVHHEKFIGNYASSFRWWDFVLDTEAGAEASKKRRERKLAAAKAKKAM